MIKFVTGLPGAGKSLRAVQLIAEAREKGRNVYVCGLDGLSPELGCEIIESPNDWESLPDGCLVVIDEAQKWWPQRRAGDAPPFIRALSEHRHHGFDFVIVTQHPSMVDKYVRTLCGEHEHILRQFGMQASKLVTWQECFDDPQSQATRDRGTAVVWRYPKHLYAMYKSATMHTVKPRIPFRMKAIPVLVLVVAALGVYAFSTIAEFGSQDQLDAVTASAGVAAVGEAPGGSSRARPKHLTVEDYVAMQMPRIAAQPWSAPIFDDREPSSEPELYCIASETLKCICHTEQGTRYQLEARECLRIVHGGGTYNPFRAPVEPQESRGDAATPSSVVQAAEYQERPPVTFRETPKYPEQSTRGVRAAVGGATL